MCEARLVLKGWEAKQGFTKCQGRRYTRWKGCDAPLGERKRGEGMRRDLEASSPFLSLVFGMEEHLLSLTHPDWDGEPFPGGNASAS